RLIEVCVAYCRSPFEPLPIGDAVVRILFPTDAAIESVLEGFLSGHLQNQEHQVRRLRVNFHWAAHRDSTDVETSFGDTAGKLLERPSGNLREGAELDA